MIINGGISMIDCLLIGHNEMRFSDYENMVSQMGYDSGAYKDLSHNFIQIDNIKMSLPEVFNNFNTKKFLDSGNRHMSLGNTFSLTIAYLASYLRTNNLSVDFINSFQDQKDNLKSMLIKDAYTTIIIPTTMYVSIFPILEIVQFIREYNSSAKVIIGGPFVSTQLRVQDRDSISYLLELLDADVYINSSQGENALLEIVKACKTNGNLDRIPNILYSSNGTYKETRICEETNILDENRINWYDFSNEIESLVAVRTSISCPYSCSFCGFPKHAGTYQTASVETIEYELNQLSKIKGIKSVNFIDDTFNIPPDRFKEILRMMIKNQYDFKWNSFFRCQFADEEMIDLMKRSGCEGVYLGIESGNPQILKNMNKSATVDQYRRGIELLKKNNILTHASFIIGFPGETEESVQDTIDFIKETKPDFYRAQTWYCEPLTPIWECKEEFQIEGSQFEWKHNTMNSDIAAEYVNKINQEIEESVRIPMYNFDFVSVFNLLHRGMTIEQVKFFLTLFNEGIREKIRYGNDNISNAIKSNFIKLFEE